jgi:hypothetical protein
MIQNPPTNYLSEIGRKGGKKSRRVLPPAVAKDMVRIREARKLFKKYYARCFWSFNRDYIIQLSDIPWVVEQLRKNGDRHIWELADKLCH